ncbi:MAG TPA: alpha-amylase family glycosyl hydrolase [Puia sp.]|nr:alpha-amylase family glycosyl hydrolase [Puia sp.]
MKTKTIFIPVLLASLCLSAAAQPGTSQPGASKSSRPGPGQREVIYHVFQRSFFDANGDRNGDLRGLTQKLDYLRQLGVTTVLLTPLYRSVFYHNYFADDWHAIDPDYGSLRDFTNLAKALHSRGMRLYVDMETQYVTDQHPWWKSAVGNERSPYRDYLLFDDSQHRKPSPIIWGITDLKGYNGVARKVPTVNLHDPGVLAYNEALFSWLADPNHDGKFDDGVDGFRLDHAMDDLDGNPRLTGLFTRFWSPLIGRLKKLNPRLIFIAEQANWFSFGFDYMSEGHIDRVFAFRLAMAINSFDKTQIEKAADTTLKQLPAGKEQVVFIENHDMDRFASRVGRDPGKERVAAVLNILLGGIPSVYYGQELGMFGKGGNNRFGNTDANDIPRREAFEWYAADTGKGMALWYKNTGPWWDSTNLKPFDGISLEEERSDPRSLWNWYRELLTLRRTNEVLQTGSYDLLPNTNPKVFSWRRRLSGTTAYLAVNLSDQPQQATVQTASPLMEVFGNATITPGHGQFTISLPPYGAGVWMTTNAGSSL